MARSDAIGKTPTVEEEMAKFKGYSTTDGEVSSGEATPHEKEVLAARANQRASAQAANNAEQERQTQDAAARQASGEEDPPAGEEEHEEGAEGGEEHQEDDQLPAGETPEQKTAREAKAVAKAKAGKDYRKSAQYRIDQAVKAQRITERAFDVAQATWQAERAELMRRLDAIEKGGLTNNNRTAKVDPNAPRKEDYEFGEFDPKFIADLTRYQVKQEMEAERQNEARAKQTAEQARAAAEFKAQKTAFAEAGSAKYDDFQEVVIDAGVAGEWPMGQVIGQLALSDPAGPDVAYYLATHLKEAQEIDALPPHKQAAAFGRLAARLSPTSTGAPAKTANGGTQTKVTQAPPPPANRARGQGGKAQPSPDTNDFAAFERMAMARN
jgi:hypothetical protein